MPTFLLFKNGQKIKELVGANPAGLQVRIHSARSVSAVYKTDIDITGTHQQCGMSVLAVRRPSRLSPIETIRFFPPASAVAFSVLSTIRPPPPP